MVVRVSLATPKKDRVYHKENCIYANRIKWDNLKFMSKEEAEKRHYCECSYCGGGLKGDFRVMKKAIRRWEKNSGVQITYVERTNTAYISTENGFWKFFMKDELGKYVLYHRNVYEKGMPFIAATKGDFHRQADVKADESMANLVKYVVAHDEAKAIIKDDYRKLPQQTRQQKKYYRQAENRNKRQEKRRLYSIFNMLERKNPELKYAYKEVAYC